MSGWHRKGIPAFVGRSDAEISTQAALARKVLEPAVPCSGRVAGWTLFERLGRFSVKSSGGDKFPLGYHVDALEPGVEALTRLEGSTITVVLSEATYDRLVTRDDPRSRFTLAHEIGHAVMHHAELRALNESLVRAAALLRAPAPPPYKDCERQADKFAAFLLAPTRGLHELNARGGLTASGIAAAFGLSLEAATIRLRTFQQKNL